MKGSWLLAAWMTIVVSVPLAVHAEKDDWSDSSYAFPKIQTVMVYNLDTSEATSIKNDIVAKTLQDAYVTRAKKNGSYVSTDPQIAPPASQPTALPAADAPPVSSASSASPATPALPAADVYIKARLLQYRQDSSFVAAHTEWRSQWIDHVVYDRDGRPYTVSQEITVPEYVPDTYIPNTTVTLRFDVYDTKTGSVVFSREETRTRYSSDDTMGVYKRIVDAFFKTLKEKMTP